MKPRISYAEFVAKRDPWTQAFEQVASLGEKAKVGQYTVHWVHRDPEWIQLKFRIRGNKVDFRMVKRGDEFIHALVSMLNH